MKCISIKQPWANLILNIKSGTFLNYTHPKNVENRTWKTNYRGIIAIHSSLTFDKEFDYTHIDINIFKRGFVLGTVEIIDCIKKYDSPWAEQDKWNWLLTNPVVIDRPFKIKGKLGIYDIDFKI